MNRIEFEDQFRVYLSMGTEYEPANVIPGEEGGSRPTEPYCSVLFISDKQIGYPLRNETDTGQTVRVHREAMYRILFYRDRARQNAHDLLHWLETEEALEEATRKGFRIMHPFDIREVTIPVADKWETRFGVNLTVAYVEQKSQVSGSIDSVNINIHPSDAEGVQVEVQSGAIN